MRQVENILGKGENAGKQHFLLLQNVFKNLLQGRLKAGLCGKDLNECEMMVLGFDRVDKGENAVQHEHTCRQQNTATQY